jgi:hypothetical protein
MPEFAILDPALMRVPAENARQTGPGDVDQLIASIKEHGVLVPLTVIQRAGWYDVIDGRRRMTAAIAAGVDRVPCLVHAEGEIRKRQREALGELADALKLQLPDAEIEVADEEDSKPPKGYDYGRAFPVKGVGEKLVGQVLEMVQHLVVEERPLLIRLSFSDSGEVWGRAFPEKERRAGDVEADDSFALSNKGNEELLKMVHAPLLAAILKDPSPFVALAAAMPKISDYSGPCYVRAEEPLDTSYRTGWAQPFLKTPIPVSVAEIVRNPMPTTVLKHMAAQLVRNLNVHRSKTVDWTLGFRHILYIYDIDPAKLLPTIAFLSTMPAAWLDEQVKRLEIKKGGGSRAKKAAAIVDQLAGTGWWPAWLANHRPLCVDQLCGIPNKIEEDEHVDPAAQPEVDAAHVGDTPGGHTGHGAVEDKTDW